MLMAKYPRGGQARSRCVRSSKLPARVLATLLLMLFASTSYAGALYVYETANPTDTAFAGAGRGERIESRLGLGVGRGLR